VTIVRFSVIHENLVRVVAWSAMKRWLAGAIEHLIPNMPRLRQK